jgi:hypothetical protein
MITGEKYDQNSGIRKITEVVILSVRRFQMKVGRLIADL